MISTPALFAGTPDRAAITTVRLTGSGFVYARFSAPWSRGIDHGHVASWPEADIRSRR